MRLFLDLDEQLSGNRLASFGVQEIKEAIP